MALLSEKTIKDAAAQAGVSEKTLRGWMAEDAAFQADYAQARRATFEAGMSRIQSLVGKAVDTLDELLTEKESPAVRLGAARAITDLGVHQQDAEAIMRKLGEIEARYESRR